jgi:hypothetical protein
VTVTVIMITTVTIAGIATGVTGIAIAIDRLDWCPTGRGPDKTSGPFYWHVIAKFARAAGRAGISPTADPSLRLKLLPDDERPQHAVDESVA